MISIAGVLCTESNRNMSEPESIRNLVDLLEDQQKLELVRLPVSVSGLEPVLSAENVKFHYGKLAQGYVTRFNAGEGDPEFNQAGAYLHNVLFAQFREPGGSNRPTGPVAALIDEKFGSYEDFQTEFEIAAMKIQGSGWIYLSRLGTIRTIANHKIRRDIALLVDFWEHAFYTDYGPNKQKYLKNIWRILDWNVINARL